MIGHDKFCQHCLYPKECCTNLIFGYDLLYYMKKSAAEFGIFEFGIVMDNIEEDSELYTTRRVILYSAKLYSQLVISKSINNGIDFDSHNSNFTVPQCTLPKFIVQGVVKEFFEWKDVTDAMY